FAYDGAGRLTARTEANGLHVEITSDTQGVPTNYQFPDGEQWVVERNAFGKLIRATDSQHELVREYDPHRRLSTEKYGEHEVRFEYGWRDLPTCIHVDRRKIRFAYDSGGNLASVQEDGFEVRIEREAKLETTVVRAGSGLSILNALDESGNLVTKKVLSA